MLVVAARELVCVAGVLPRFSRSTPVLDLPFVRRSFSRSGLLDLSRLPPSSHFPFYLPIECLTRPLLYVSPFAVLSLMLVVFLYFCVPCFLLYPSLLRGLFCCGRLVWNADCWFSAVGGFLCCFLFLAFLCLLFLLLLFFFLVYFSFCFLSFVLCGVWFPVVLL